jgi:hypothetical protein
MALAYASRVLPLRIVAVRNSMKRLPAFSPAPVMIAGRMGPPVGAATMPGDVLASSLGMVALRLG